MDKLNEEGANCNKHQLLSDTCVCILSPLVALPRPCFLPDILSSMPSECEREREREASIRGDDGRAADYRTFVRRRRGGMTRERMRTDDDTMVIPMREGGDELCERERSMPFKRASEATK